jgi:hypothetical protein
MYFSKCAHQPLHAAWTTLNCSPHLSICLLALPLPSRCPARRLQGKTADIGPDPKFWTGVLVVPTDEILISGSVLRETNDNGVVVKLDTPIPDACSPSLRAVAGRAAT